MRLKNIVVLALAITSSIALPCNWCKNAGKNLPASPPSAAQKPPAQENLRILASKPTKGPAFSAGFFNSVGKEDEETAQPEAIPDGDDGSFRLIFK